MFGHSTFPALPAGLKYVEVAGGYEHSVARRSDGSVVAFGRNQFGQWVSIQRYTLGRLSGKLFKIPRTRGTYRTFLTINQAGPGYLESWSGTQPVRR